MEKRKMQNTNRQKPVNSANTTTISTQHAAARSRRLSGTAFAIIALTVLLAASVILGITGAYFTGTQTVSGDITLGNPVNISITQGGAAVTSLTFAGSALPGTVYDQAISISSPADTSEAVLRAKLTVTNNDGAATNVVATPVAGWNLNATDSYYYYDGSITAGNSVNFITQIEVPTTLTNVDANKTYSIDVVVEAIQKANGAASAIWTDAPSAWKTAYGSD